MLKLASIGLALTLAGTACAQAGVAYSFSVDPTSIAVGSSATLDLTLTYTPDPGFNFIEFSGAGSIFSGDGQEAPVSWNSQTVSFSQPFTYALSGTYSPSFSIQYFFFAGSSDGRAEAGSEIASGQATLQVSSVPEADTWAMMLLGFAAMGIAVRSGWNKRVQPAAL